MEPENIIIYRLGSLGDTIVALPCFHRIARSFPTANRIVLTNFPVSTKAAPLETVLGGSGLVHRAIAYPVGTRSLLKLWRLFREIRALKASTLIYLMPTRGYLRQIRDIAFFRFCGLRHIIGYPRSVDHRQLRMDHATHVRERECERLARTLSDLGPLNLDAPDVWDLLLTEQEKSAGRKSIEDFGDMPFIAVNMGGKAAEKDWGTSRWQKLLRVLGATYSSYGLLIVGGAEDSVRANALAQSWPNRVINACGTLTPRETAAALQAAAIFVGHDSGPLHLAAASHVPCVGLYGNFNRPKKWHPYGELHHIIHCMEGISAITIDEVAKAVSALLPVPAARLESVVKIENCNPNAGSARSVLPH